MEIFYIQYESSPTPSSSDYEDTGGAYINCWIKASSLEKAKEVAIKYIEDGDWSVTQLEESFSISEDFYEENDESLEYYRQAELDGECYVYHKWPNEPQEDDQIN